MKKNSSFPVLIFVVILGIGAALAYAMYRVSADFEALWILGGAVVLGPSSSLPQFRLRISGARPWSCGSVSSAPFRDRDCFSLFRSSTRFPTGSTSVSSRLRSRRKKL